MAITPQQLFASLQPGDLLMIPMSLPSDKGKQITTFSTVLRVGPEGELYLSYPDERRATAQGYPRCNPFRWDPKKAILVDKDGDVPSWYSVDIALERGGAKRQADLYATVPRLEQVKPEHVFDTAAFKRFLSENPRCAQLDGIVTNGEAGQATWQLSLALDLMGVQYTKEQLLGLSYFMERFESHNKMAAIHVVLAERNDIEADRAAAKPKTH